MKIFIFLVLTLSLNVGRCEWIKFTQDDIKNDYFYEASKLTVTTYPEAKYVSGWIMMNYGKPFVMKNNKVINSQKDNFQINCKFKSNVEEYKLMFTAYYSGKNGTGGMTYQNDYGFGLSQKIIPDSMVEYFVEYFCKM